MTAEQSKEKLPAPFVEYAHKKTRDFLRACVLDGATARFLEDPSGGKISREDRERRFRVTVMYFGTSLSGTETGVIYGGGASKESVRQMISKTLESLWSRASPEIQDQFPLREIPKNKWRQLNTLISRGLKHGRKSSLVADMSRKGAVQEEIAATVGTKSLRSIIGIEGYMALGIDVPYTPKHIESKKIREDLVDKNLSFEQVRELWERIGIGRIRELTQQGWVISLNDLAGFAGLHIRSPQVQNLTPFLEAKQVASGHYQRQAKLRDGKFHTQNYYCIRQVDTEKAIAALMDAEQLKPYFNDPVKLLTGPENSAIPSSARLRSGKEYSTLGYLLEANGILLRNGKPITQAEFFAGCPLSVYFYNNSYYYSNEAEREFSRFIRRRKKELGI